MKSRSRFFIASIILALLVMIVISPSVYMEAALQGLELFAYKVFPALFPFFIITRLLTMLGVGKLISRALDKPLKYMYNAPPIGGYIFTLSILSGYPIGAKLISEFRQNGMLSCESAKRMISFTSTSGPLFILGTVGLKLMGDYKAGVIILISHVLGAVLNGFVFRADVPAVQDREIITSEVRESFFNNAVSSSITAILQVAASMVILNVFIAALDGIGIISAASGVLVTLGVNENLSTGISYGAIEMTQGIAYICSQGQKIKDIIVPVSVLISFGGASVMLQSMNFLSSIGIKVSYYFVTKISQALLTFVTASLLVLIFY